jgi:hypothetical protein
MPERVFRPCPAMVTLQNLENVLIPQAKDVLQELMAVPTVAPEIHAPRPALAASVEAVLERLATWLTDFAAGSAPATLKTVRSDWMQIHLLADTYLRREFASNSRPAPRSNP